MNEFKAKVEALPENPTAADLSAINEAETAYTALKAEYALSDEQVGAFVGTETMQKLEHAKQAVEESLARIQAVEARISALFGDNGSVKASARTEYDNLTRIMAGETVDGVSLTEAERNAMSSEAKDKLAEAKTGFETMDQAIEVLNGKISALTDSYTSKEAVAGCRGEYESLVSTYGVTPEMVSEYQMLTEREAFQTQLDTEIVSVNEAIDAAGEWSYANKAAYEGLRARVDALLSKDVPEAVLHIDTLSGLEAKTVEAEGAMNEFKAKVETLPSDVTVGDLASVNEVATAYNAVTTYRISDEQIAEYLQDSGATVARYQAAVKQYEESIQKIQIVQNRIFALYQNGKIQYGTDAEIDALTKIMAGETVDGVSLNDAERRAVDGKASDFLGKAPVELAQLKQIVAGQNEALSKIPQNTYAAKKAAEEARAALESLRTENCVPSNEETYSNYAMLVAAETFVQETDQEIEEVCAGFAALPEQGTVKVTDQSILDNLSKRYDALLKRDGVAKTDVPVDWDKWNEAKQEIQNIWNDALALNRDLATVPEAGNVLYSDKAQLDSLKTRMEQLAADRGVLVEDPVYTFMGRYRAARAELERIESEIRLIEQSIASLLPWQAGRTEQYNAIDARIAALLDRGVTTSNISNYHILQECRAAQQAADSQAQTPSSSQQSGQSVSSRPTQSDSKSTASNTSQTSDSDSSSVSSVSVSEPASPESGSSANSVPASSDFASTATEPAGRSIFPIGIILLLAVAAGAVALVIVKRRRQ